MSKQTFAIVTGIVGAVTICACFMNPETKLINKK